MLFNVSIRATYRMRVLLFEWLNLCVNGGGEDAYCGVLGGESIMVYGSVSLAAIRNNGTAAGPERTQ